MPSLVQRYLDQIALTCADTGEGAVADYIPELGAVDPDQFGLALAMHRGSLYTVGDAHTPFTIQSVSKPLTYALALALKGFDAVDAKLGVEPSGEAFNEISVDPETHRPKNPMINAGAIVAASLVCDPDDPRAGFARLLDWYSAFAGRSLVVDEAVYQSEKSTGARNRAITYMLQSLGMLDVDPELAVDLYFRQCSVQVTAEDLAVIGATLAAGGNNPRTGRDVCAPHLVRRVLSVMTTCGMYDGAGDWVSAVGLPAKSGVSGAVLAVLPGQLGIGVFSPRLDEHGNSVRGVTACRRLSADLGLHMFNVAGEGRVTVRSSYDIREVPSGTPRDERAAAILRARSDRVRVYDLQGPLTFTSMESVLQRLDADAHRFDVAILNLGRVETADALSRGMLFGMHAQLQNSDRLGLLVDPDRVLSRESGAWTLDAVRQGKLIAAVESARTHIFRSLPEAVSAAEDFLLGASPLR
jgi:glutaminase